MKTSPITIFSSSGRRSTPTIYAYQLEGVSSHKGYIKVGFTDRDADARIKEQLHTSAVPYKILYTESAMRPDGSCFTDHDVHTILKQNGIKQLNEGEDRNEWFFCSVNEVRAAVNELKNGEKFNAQRTENFKMRPEQTRAVMRTMEYFESAKRTTPPVRRNSSGTQKCVSERPLRHISSARK